MRRAVLLVLPLLLLAAPAAAAPKRWWDRDWSHRKRVVLSERQTWPESPSVRVRFSTGRRARPDGSDVRVTTAKRREVPCAVIARGPGDLLEVAFPAGGEREWHVYYGNPGAEAPEDPFVPDRGLVLETRGRGPGNPTGWAAMRKILAASKPVHGGSSWPRVFDATNPFGPDDHYVSDYRGFLRVREKGVHTFFTASDEASFLLIDGKLVVQWPGYHTAGAGAWAKFRGKVDLEPGLHAFRYVHLERTGRQVMAAYWQPPGAKRATVIPPQAFPGHREAVVVKHEVRGKDVAADFTTQVKHKWGLEDRVFSGLVLAARPAGRDAVFRWDFGDGVEGEGAEAYHVYLEGGDYEVTLEAESGGESDRIVRTIHVPDEWTRFDRNRDDVLEIMADTAAAYPVRELDARKAERLVFLLDAAERPAEAVRVLEAALGAAPAHPDERRYRFAMDLGRRCRDDLGDRDRAVRAFRQAANAARRGKREVEARVRMAEALLLLGGDAETARRLLATATDVVGMRGGDTSRRAWLRLGDARMIAGEGARARAAYEKAEELAGGPEDVRRLLRKAGETRSALTHLESGDGRRARDALARWE